MRLNAGIKIGNYTLLERIGNPNMGDVWRAASPANPTTPVVIKALDSRFEQFASMRDRFETECAVHQNLVHPNIVPVRECFLHARELFLVMPFVAGGSLEDRLRRGPLPQDEAIRIAIQVLDALDYANQRGFVHCDVKPSNILLQGNRALITDFGVAHSFLEGPATRSECSGTIAYMSPEQIQTPQTVDQRSDVYGFGCVLYEMLTGRAPFPMDAAESCTDDQIKIMHVTRTPIPPRAINPAIDPRLERIVMQALQKQPADRFAGCGSFALALRDLVQPVIKPIPPFPVRYAVAIAAGLFLLGFVGALIG